SVRTRRATIRNLSKVLAYSFRAGWRLSRGGRPTAHPVSLLVSTTNRKTCIRAWPAIDFRAAFASQAAGPLAFEHSLYAGWLQIGPVPSAARVNPIAGTGCERLGPAGEASVGGQSR